MFIIIVPNAFLRDVDLLNVVAPQNLDWGNVEMKGERLCQKSVGFFSEQFLKTFLDRKLSSLLCQ
jgi:hypothetical protein